MKAALLELLVLESHSDAGQRGTAPHTHRAHTDCFFVVEGELVFHLARERRRAPAGSFGLAPPGLVHGFEVGENGPRYLNLHAPGREYAALVRARRDRVEFDAARGDTLDPPPDGGKSPGESECASSTSTRRTPASSAAFAVRRATRCDEAAVPASEQEVDAIGIAPAAVVARAQHVS
ncbi:MAG: cupin domain-containing protein [Actinomycetota bacterium]|nr:cupin domain-containing protein [Actinomycetota bacterium]